MNSDRLRRRTRRCTTMVAAAMEESWGRLPALHMESITATIATVIADGVASGEFRVNRRDLRRLNAHAPRWARFFHPQLIAEEMWPTGPVPPWIR